MARFGKAWIGLELPFRVLHENFKISKDRFQFTYGIFSWETLPPLGQCHCYSHINTLDDLLHSKPIVIQSPTSCFFDLNGCIFYRDLENYVYWTWDERWGVLACLPNNTKYVVADTVGDFLKRMELEFQLWYAAYSTCCKWEGIKKRQAWLTLKFQKKELQEYMQHYKDIFHLSLQCLVDQGLWLEDGLELVHFFVPRSTQELRQNIVVETALLRQLKQLKEEGHVLQLKDRCLRPFPALATPTKQQVQQRFNL